MINIEINVKEIERAPHVLNHIKNGVPKAMMRAINRTLTTVRSDSVKDVKQEVDLPATKIRTTFRYERASLSDLSGAVISKGKEIPLIHYNTRPKDRGRRKPPVGVSATTYKSMGQQVYPGSFIARGGSHKGVFKRVSQPRLPIEELFGPSVPEVLSEDPTYSDVTSKAERKLNDRFQHELNYLLQRAAK